MKNYKSKFKLFLTVALFICLASSQFAQALTMQEIVNEQGKVLGASTPLFVQAASNAAYSGNAVTANFSSSLTAGDLIAVATNGSGALSGIFDKVLRHPNFPLFTPYSL